MLKFKNKSEQTSYLRVVKRILSLPGQLNQQKQMFETDLEFTYMKIFRFLSDVLSKSEFHSLSYYHVASFVQRVLQVHGDEEEEKGATRNDQTISLRQFIYSALDLHYEQS